VAMIKQAMFLLNLRAASCHCAKQFTFQYELALLVLLCGFIGLVVLPAHRLVALFAFDVSNDMPTCRHIAFHCLGLFDVHYRRE